VAFHLDITPFTQLDQSVGYATDRQFLYANNPAIPTDEIDSTRFSTSTEIKWIVFIFLSIRQAPSQIDASS